MRRLRVLTWHVHGTYLWYLSHLPHDLVVPVRPGRPPGYAGVAGSWAWPGSVQEVPADEVRDLELDVVVSQSERNWTHDRLALLTPAQRALPRVHIEHDPPRRSPTDTRHVVDDPDALVVHVTAFNELMWDNADVPTAVVDHGVVVPGDAAYRGTLDRGVVVVNHLASRGRRLGADVFARVRSEVPLDLYGMAAEELGGCGELDHTTLLRREADYRFFFTPIRYTSLGLAICEAMMVGLPVLGPATTELVTVVRNGENGFVETDVERLVAHACRLLADPDEAKQLGRGARRTAEARFGIERFVRDWDHALQLLIERGAHDAAEVLRAERRAAVTDTGGRAFDDPRPLVTTDR